MRDLRKKIRHKTASYLIAAGHQLLSDEESLTVAQLNVATYMSQVIGKRLQGAFKAMEAIHGLNIPEDQIEEARKNGDQRKKP